MSFFEVNQLTIAGNSPCSFSLGKGEILFIHGPSGCGKTLLLRALADLDQHSGTISLNGTLQEQFLAWEWRKKVGLLAAESVWWQPLVKDHFPEAQTVAQDLSHELHQLQLPAKIMAQEIIHLSTGERQRLALLRLLANKPQVLLLDEPTANLDSENSGRMEQLIITYCNRQQAAAIWVSHDQQQSNRLAQQILTFSGTEICLRGPGKP